MKRRIFSRCPEAPFDMPVLAVGGLVTAALSVGLATALLSVSRTTTGPNVGPTAATLNDAFSTLCGAALGLLGGSGVTARFARRGSRTATGILAGFFAYAAVLGSSSHHHEAERRRRRRVVRFRACAQRTPGVGR